jgi:hypothetical protein
MAQERNNTLSLDIEQIVREVLRRLSGEQNNRPQNQSSANGKEVIVHKRVVTLAELDGELTGASQLVVPRGAVVTPAVKDLLRQSGVALTFRADTKKTSGENKHRLTVAVAETDFDTASLLRAIEDQFASTQQIAKTGLINAVDELAVKVARGGDLGLLLTSKTAAAACLANRQRGVRAVVAENTASVPEAITEIGANLLIVDPARKGVFELKQIIKVFAAPGPRECPSYLRERLG